jgi:hypothetical protein
MAALVDSVDAAQGEQVPGYGEEFGTTQCLRNGFEDLGSGVSGGGAGHRD